MLAVVAGAAYEHRAGAPAPRWRAVVSGPAVPQFEAVAALSSRDVWAVGAIGKDPRLTPVAAHWDGRSLSVTKPFPPSVHGTLDGVAALAPTDVWAVATLVIGRQRPFESRGAIVHWDGRRWTRVATSVPPASNLFDVTATWGTDVWVGGTEVAKVRVNDPIDSGTVDRPLLMHWDGSRWRRDDVSRLVRQCPWRENVEGQVEWVWTCDASIAAIDAAARNDVWAAGTEEAVDFAGYSSTLLHSNGGSWKALGEPATKDSGGLSAADVDATAPGEAWTLDDFVDASVESEYRLVHWTKGRARAFEYQTRGASVAALAAVSSRSVWIVGERWSDDGNVPLGPMVIHWNGMTAVRQRTTFDSQRGATLAAVSALSPVEIWAAGDHLLARYSS